MGNKKSLILSSLLLFVMFIALSGQQLNLSETMKAVGPVTMQEMQPAGSAVHPVAARALARGEKPGGFNNVSYRYSGNVKVLTPAQKNKLRLIQDGILDLSGSAFKPSPDSVYVDPASDLVLQAQPVDEKSMLALRPSLSAVFEDIEVPEQEVPVTLANTVSMAQGIVESAMGQGSNYAVNLQFDSLVVTIDSTKEGSLKAALVGQIVITDPRVEGRYSKNGGYSLVFKASEQVDMKVYATVKAKKEIKTPIWGTEMKISDLGKCEVGLFMLINMEGEVSLAFEIHQGINMALGAKGGTFWYIPTSLKNISTVDHYCDIDYNVMAKLKAFAGVQVTANLKVKGYDALDVYVNGGMEGTVESDAVTLNADVGFRIKAGGKIVSKKFTLVDKYFSLWKLQKPDYQGYDMVIHEACAWGDYVVGEIHTITDSKTLPGLKDTIPYQGQLTVIVSHPGNSVNQYPATTDSEGIFVAKSVSLKKGDKVTVKLAGVNNPSPAVDATIPFKEVSLWSVDYYAGIAEGSVAGMKSRWAKLAGKVQGPSSSSAAVAAVAASQQNAVQRFKGAIPPQEAVRRIEEFRNSLIVYRGPIEFITQASPVVISGTAPAPGTRAAGQPVAAAKPQPNRGAVNSPVGLFSISGLSFEPGQKVRARINVEGFTVESDWVETEGLMVSVIESDKVEKSISPGNETLSSSNSFVVVSALRSDKSPSGIVKMVKGADAPHGSLMAAQPVPEFPEAKKAKIWFSMSKPLIPVEGNPGASIASTGPWSVTYSYSSPGDALLPLKNRKHPFEMVSYTYKDRELGYTSYINECASCTSPVNIIEKLGKTTGPAAFNKIDSQKLQQKVNAPVKQKVTQPAVIR
jgi:hypothetical protein